MGTMQRVRLYEKHISLFNNKGFRLHLKISLSGGDKKNFNFRMPMIAQRHLKILFHFSFVGAHRKKQIPMLPVFP